MNILHHKSWHVRNKDNIAKVRRDEAEAAEKEEAEVKRAKLAEQEARLRYLRNRSRGSSGQTALLQCQSNKVKKDPSSKVDENIFTAEGNINFFKDVEAGVKVTGTNKDHEAEAKNEKEDYEKKIGLLTYLGQDTLEATGGKEWYSETSKSLTHFKDDKSNTNPTEEVQFKNKSRLDPLAMYVKTVLPVGPSKFNNSLDSLTPAAITKYCKMLKAKKKLLKKHKHKRKCKKAKKSKKSHKKRRKSSDSESCEDEQLKKKEKGKDKVSSESSSEEEEYRRKKIEQLAKLREERLKRETSERKREERLLNGKDPDVEEVVKVDLPYTQKYSSQFNPHIARQNEWLTNPVDLVFTKSKR